MSGGAGAAADKVDIFMPLYPADYLADTMDLSTEEHGAYLLLLMSLWRNKGRILNDPRRLATTTRVPLKQWPAMWAAIGRFFDVDRDGMISQGRVLAEIEGAKDRKAAAQMNGKKGGLAKARVARNLLAARQGSASKSASKSPSKTVPEGLADSGSSPSPSPSPSLLPELALSPDPESSRPSRADPDPERAIPVPQAPSALATWPSGKWRDKFAAAWCEKYQRIAYGNAGDGKACGNLADLLERLPPEECARAQASAPAMIAEFLADESPGVVKAGHPFSFFVTAFGGLGVTKPRNGPTRDVRYGHTRAEDFQHTRTGEVKL